MTPSFDIFCRIVDNFGDIGVCWRLAKQLSQRPDTGRIRLWVDRLDQFARIEPKVRPGALFQQLDDIDIRHWTPPHDAPRNNHEQTQDTAIGGSAKPAPRATPHDVVIEAFACQLPADFIQAMQEKSCLWLNLEYLSAEDWVQGFHGLASHQTNRLRKYFYFPGFTDKTGGLLREPDLQTNQAAWLAQPELHGQLLHQIGMPARDIKLVQTGWRQVFCFCYKSTLIPALAHALQNSAPTVLILAPGIRSDLDALQSKNLIVFESPFVSQDQFDRLLWSSHLNIVRGEDSLLRAIWAGKPFLWDIYKQDEDAHLLKLDAWLTQNDVTAEISALMQAWNVSQETAVAQKLTQALYPDNWATWQQNSLALRSQLAAQTSLCDRLIAFCTEKTQSG